MRKDLLEVTCVAFLSFLVIGCGDAQNSHGDLRWATVNRQAVEEAIDQAINPMRNDVDYEQSRIESAKISPISMKESIQISQCYESVKNELSSVGSSTYELDQNAHYKDCMSKIYQNKEMADLFNRKSEISAQPRIRDMLKIQMRETVVARTNEVLAEYCKEEGISLLLAAGTQKVVYSQSGVVADVTDDVVRYVKSHVEQKK